MNRKNDKESGQGLVEFALILPILLMVLLGVIEFSRLMYSIMIVSASAQEAARYGAATGTGTTGDPRYMDCPGIIGAATRIGSLAGVTAGDVTISYDRGPNDPGTGITCPPASADLIDTENRIRVNISTQYYPLFGIVQMPGGIPIHLEAEAARTIIKTFESP